MKDSTHIELFFKTYYFRLYSYAMHIVHDDEEAKDIVYDCFEYMWNHYDDRDVKKWQTYAYSFIRNKCIDSLRHQDVSRKYIELYFQLTQEEIRRERDISDRMELIREALLELPESIRVVVTKSFYYQLTYKEIGMELNISESMVKKRMAKALDYIRDKVAKKNK